MSNKTFKNYKSVKAAIIIYKNKNINIRITKIF